jgi:hypothetical protein
MKTRIETLKILDDKIFNDKILQHRHPRTFFIAVNILDHFLSDKKYTLIEMYTIVTGCFYLATKFFNETEINLKQLTNLFNVKLKQCDLKKMINTIMETLDYKLYNITLYDDMASKGLDTYLTNIMKFLVKNLSPNIPVLTNEMLSAV